MSEQTYEKKLEKLLKSVEKSLGKDDNEKAAWAYKEAAKLAEEHKEYRKSIDYILKAIELNKKRGKYFNVGWLYKLAALTAEHESLKEAIEYALKSADYLKKSGNLYAAQWSYNIAARLSRRNKDLYSAIRYYKKSQKICFDKEIQEEIEKLKNDIPHPVVSVCCDEKEVEDGKEVKFFVDVNNTERETLKDVKLLDEKKNIVEELGDIGPKESKRLSYIEKASAGPLKSRCRFVSWKNRLGDKFVKEIKSHSITVKPKIELRTAINPPLRLNKSSDFIILMKNLSSSKIKNIKFSVDFPEGLEGKPDTNLEFEQIRSGEEKGVVFSLTPKNVGKVKIDDISVEYEDEYGTRYETIIELMTKVVLGERSIEPSPEKITETPDNSIEEHKKSLNIQSNPISEENYLSKKNSLQSVERGISYDDIDIETAAQYIEDECRSFTQVGVHNHGSERLYLFSGIGKQEYLLTIALKKKGKLLNILFKLYSQKKDEAFLDKIVNIIDYTVRIMGSAKRVEKMEVKEVINIIDSLVQRSKIGYDIPKTKEIRIKDSVVQKTEV